MKRFACLLTLCLVPIAGLHAQSWVELTPAAGPVPDGRRNAAAIYDPVDHRLVIFSGRISASEQTNDVWSFDLDSHTWTDLTPATGPSPAPRFTPNAVYDPVQHAMIIWAGQGEVDFFNDVWAFDLSAGTWSEYQPPAPRPNIRYGTAAIFDPIGRKLISFAGFTDLGRFDDTWSFGVDSVEWADVSPAVGPVERCLHSASYDIPGHRMIVYGGQQNGPRDDIWAYDIASGTWTDLTPTTRPVGRFFTSFVYDSTRHRNVIFGGVGLVGGETWEFDLATGTFTQLFPAGTPPSSRYGATGDYIVAEDRMILFGGDGGGLRNDVWSLEMTPTGELTLPWEITADGDTFHWPVPANIEWVRGRIEDLDGYVTETGAAAAHATSFIDSGQPPAGSGFWYLVRFQGARGSWQTAPGAESARDSSIP